MSVRCQINFESIEMAILIDYLQKSINFCLVDKSTILQLPISPLVCLISQGVRLAQKFEALVLADHRFEIPAVRYLGMYTYH